MVLNLDIHLIVDIIRYAPGESPGAVTVTIGIISRRISYRAEPTAGGTFLIINIHQVSSLNPVISPINIGSGSIPPGNPGGAGGIHMNSLAHLKIVSV